MVAHHPRPVESGNVVGRHRRWRGWVSVLLGLLAVAGPAPAADAFHAFMDPEISYVPIDSTVTVAFAVDSTARAFNGYEVTIEYDAARLDLIGIEEGSLMTGTCGFTFVDVDSAAEGTVTYTHVLLCAGTAADGPGELSRFTFRAIDLGYASVALTSDPACTFFDAGLCVNPDHPTDPREVSLVGGEIRVYDPILDATDGPAPQIELRARVYPVPGSGADGWISVEGSADERLDVRIFDVTGRELWRFEGRSASTGGTTLRWRSERTASGVLFYRVTAGGRTDTGRLPLVR